jgi:hypothetical protein
MRIHKSGHEILSVEDWFSYAPPKKGELQWKDRRSAKELAQSWFRDDTPKSPDELGALMEAKFDTGIIFDEAKPECIIELDEFVGEHRNCDLVVLCNAGAKRMVINVEAKADEPFGDLIGEYFDRKAGSGSNVPARIRQLSLALFGREPDEAIRKLRYQLLHAVAATLIEAAANRAELGTVLGSRVSVCEPKQRQARAERHRLGDLCSRISRARYCSNRKEPNSRSGFGTGRRARAKFSTALSRTFDY